MEGLYLSTSSSETKEIAKKLVLKLESGTTICLHGDLAAGKTTFTQGIAEALSIDRLISPTFIIMREYSAHNHQSISYLYHLDLYRLSSSEEIKAFDLTEIMKDNHNLVVIEWPDRIEDILPQDRIDVYLKATDTNEREISIKYQKQ